jgi:hypothetical protein
VLVVMVIAGLSPGEYRGTVDPATWRYRRGRGQPLAFRRDSNVPQPGVDTMKTPVPARVVAGTPVGVATILSIPAFAVGTVAGARGPADSTISVMALVLGVCGRATQNALARASTRDAPSRPWSYWVIAFGNLNLTLGLAVFVFSSRPCGVAPGFIYIGLGAVCVTLISIVEAGTSSSSETQTSRRVGAPSELNPAGYTGTARITGPACSLRRSNPLHERLPPTARFRDSIKL